MSALSDLVYGKGQGPWPHFIDKYPVKEKNMASIFLTVEHAGYNRYSSVKDFVTLNELL